MHQDRQQLTLISARAGGQVPEIGIEGQVTGGTNETDEFIRSGVDQADLPETAFQRFEPLLLRVGGFPAGLQQIIEGRRGGTLLGFNAAPFRKLGNLGLLKKGKQGESAGVAHASRDAIEGEQCSTKQFAAAVGPAILRYTR